VTAAAARLAADRLTDWLLGDPARLAGFMDATGWRPADLRAGLQTLDLARATVDYLLSDERLLLAACADLDLPPDTPARLQAVLGGAPPAAGDWQPDPDLSPDFDPDWTRG